MRRRFHRRKPTAKERKRLQALAKENELRDRREVYAEKIDEDFWLEYIALCRRFKRFIGSGVIETSVMTVKSVSEVEDYFEYAELYSYNCYRSKRK